VYENHDQIGKITVLKNDILLYCSVFSHAS